MGVTLPLLFLSGAGLPAWVWDVVRRRLPVESRVADHPRGRAGSADHAEAARAAAADRPAYGVVAHSIGGVVAAALVARDANRVHAVTAVCGIVPRPDTSFVASLPMPKCLMMGAIVRFVGTKPPDSVIRSGLCHGLADVVAERVVADLRGVARALPRRCPGAPLAQGETYVATTEDTEFPVAPTEVRRGAGRDADDPAHGTPRDAPRPGRPGRTHRTSPGLTSLIPLTVPVEDPL